jgi:hypothetical protein
MYGKSGIGKTANLKMLAKWFYETYKLRVRMVHSDGGGYNQFRDKDNLIGKGIVQVIDNTDREYALADIHRLAGGNWPDKNGILARDMSLVDKRVLQKRFEKEEIGAYFIEGVTSLADTLLSHFSDQLTTQSVGFKASYVYQEQEYALGGMDKGHYGIVQRELHKIIVKEFGQLPVRLVVWTAKPRLGIDRDSGGEPVIGPEGAGIADTQRIPSWFENALHLEKITARMKRGEKIVEEELRVAWYQQHDIDGFGPNGTPIKIPCLAKSSVPSEEYPGLLNQFKGGFVQLGFQRGIDKYLEYIESLERREANA